MFMCYTFSSLLNTLKKLCSYNILYIYFYIFFIFSLSIGFEVILIINWK